MYSIGGVSFLKRKKLTINNNSGAALTDYQVPITVTYTAAMQTDFDDIRFVDASGNLLPYWIESKTDSSTAAVWIKCNLPNYGATPTGDNILYMYYGNADLTSASNGTNTFVQWHGAATTNFKDTAVASIPFIYEAKIKTGGSGYHIWGAVNADGLLGDNPAINRYVQVPSYYREQYFSVKDASAKNESSNGAGSFPDATWKRTKIFAASTTSATNTFTGNSNIVLTSNVPSDVLGLSMRLIDGTGEQEFSFIRKYTATEPTVTTGAAEHSRKGGIIIYG